MTLKGSNLERFLLREAERATLPYHCRNLNLPQQPQQPDGDSAEQEVPCAVLT